MNGLSPTAELFRRDIEKIAHKPITDRKAHIINYFEMDKVIEYDDGEETFDYVDRYLSYAVEINDIPEGLWLLPVYYLHRGEQMMSQIQTTLVRHRFPRKKITKLINDIKKSAQHYLEIAPTLTRPGCCEETTDEA